MIEEIKPNLFVKQKKNGTYSLVFPIAKDITKPFSIKTNCNWKHLIAGGSWFNLFKIFFIVVVILFSCWAYSHDMKACNQWLENPEVINCLSQQEDYSNQFLKGDDIINGRGFVFSNISQTN